MWPSFWFIGWFYVYGISNLLLDCATVFLLNTRSDPLTMWLGSPSSATSAISKDASSIYHSRTSCFRKLHFQWSTIALMRSTFWNKHTKERKRLCFLIRESQENAIVKHVGPPKGAQVLSLSCFLTGGSEEWKGAGKDCGCRLAHFLQQTPSLPHRWAQAAGHLGRGCFRMGQGPDRAAPRWHGVLFHPHRSLATR